ncbi:BTAD domain-containing putative transcriptional regulator [Streptacidiphilus sp. PB12-B1b]|uniref:AfsR/SARP family transcriptional regulator n=1 Tax=Streptacidiphilus sp. PB12-B1b TaxID=2705012 RepID=UPI001CDC7AE9|nr:BTAD domain-containing putative transcriptional regulator [Streptacidiphilus sp. PB12-B1b]
MELRSATAGPTAGGRRPPRPEPRRAGAGLRFGVLGPLEVRTGGRELPLGSPKQRLVLALLLCEPGAVVPVARLLDALWPGEQPRNARKTVQVYVSGLRRILEAAGGEARIAFRFSGYRIALCPAELDSERFDQLVREGDRCLQGGEPEQGTAVLRQALALWRGPVLREFEQVEAVRRAAARLTERRLSVSERWAEAELALRGPSAVLDALAELAWEHPLRERLRALQISAFRQAGQVAEALAVYDEVRQGLARDFGLAPGPAVRQAHRELLEQGPVRGPGPRWAPPAPRSRPRLPPEPEDFTGRAGAAEWLGAQLTGPAPAGAVVLHGQVGVGKTALALHAGHRLRAGFPDGCVLLRLRGGNGAPRPLASVLAELWQIAGLPGTAPADDETAAAVWQDRAASLRLLLVLDDARDETVVRRLVPHDGPGRALITSRSRLSALGRASRFELPPLPPEQALRLFERVLGPERTARDPRAAEHIVRLTGLLPLGVRVAADRLAALPHLSLADFASRLGGGPRLDLLRVGDVSVRERLDAALADLPQDVRALLPGVGSLPPGPFTQPEAEAATGAAGDAVCALLEALIENGVVSAPDREQPQGLARFALPPLMHLRLREPAALSQGF